MDRLCVARASSGGIRFLVAFDRATYESVEGKALSDTELSPEKEPLKSFPNCDHESVGHNDGQCCAVCELGEKVETLQAQLKSEWQRRLSDDEIDEAVARLMEYAGFTTSGLEWRSLRDTARDIEEIVRDLLRGAFDESEPPEGEKPR